MFARGPSQVREGGREGVRDADLARNPTRKWYARALLVLAHYGKQALPQEGRPQASQEMLAEIVGTTRSRVNCFMNEFGKLGFIRYNHVDKSLLSVVLHD